MEGDFGYVQDVTADLDSGVITSIMVARNRIDVVGLYLRRSRKRMAILQSLEKNTGYVVKNQFAYNMVGKVEM